MNHRSEDDAIHVVSLADNNYAQHLSVTFASLLANLSPNASVRLYVMSTDFNQSNREKLRKTAAKYGAAIQFIEVDGSAYENFSLFTFVTKESFIRLSIPDVVPPSVRKVICIDSDTVVTGDIAEMWAIDLEGHAIAAVTDIGGIYRCKELQIPSERYFNAGIYIMDLTKWREQSIGGRTMAYIAEHTKKLIYLDQDALNAILYDDWLEMPDRWNVQTNMAGRKPWTKDRLPGIIHYTGAIKPWHFNSTHPYKEQYYKYLKLTEWSGYRPSITVGTVFKRISQPVEHQLKQLLPRPAVSALRKLKAYLS